MTTENVAILFTDIVGSTELSQRLSAEVADDVRRRHFSILRQAITESGGTEVKNLGDGLMVVFNSASAALGCAVAMQQGVDQENRSGSDSVGLRVGLSVGEASNEDGDYFGDPVVEAARLCAHCNSGEILATEFVQVMAGRRGRHECRPLGELSLKGLSEPVEAVEVLWEPIDRVSVATIPLPGRLSTAPNVGVVGRSAEAESISAALKRVTSGGPREVVVVSGEAGLGKTTLVAELSRHSFNAGACVLFGHCEEDLATPYQLFAEVLGHFVTHAPEEQLRAHVDVYGSELARLVPALASRIRDLPPSKSTDTDSERFLLFAAVVGLLSEVSQDQLVVIVLDDLQWADKGSLMLLRHVVGSDVPMRLLVLGTYRDSELSASHALVDTLAALRRMDGVSRIELTGLDDTGVMALMESAAGHELDDEAVGLAHAIYRETDGNPFFVSEVLRNLVETGAIRQDADGRWKTEVTLDVRALPDSVREVIGARVLRLGKEAGRILSVAAVIGRDFDLNLLAAATNTEQDDVLDVLDAAGTVSLVRELTDAPGHFSFAHALIQRTLYEDLGPTRGARAHRHVAEALEELCGGTPGTRVGELARHWFSATQPIDLTKAIGYSQLAGDAALLALAPGDALRYYSQALDLCSQASDVDPLLAIDLGIGLGTAQRQTGDPAYRDTLLHAANQAAVLGDTDRLVQAVLANNRGFLSNLFGIDTEKVNALELAQRQLPVDHRDRALALALLCQELTIGSSLERRQALADEAIAIAETSGDDATMVRVLNAVMHPLGVPHLIEQSLRWSDEALVRSQRLGDPVLLFWTLAYRVYYTTNAGNLDERDRCLDMVETLADQLNQPILDWSSGFLAAAKAQIAGDNDLADQLARLAYEIGTESGQADALLVYSGLAVAIGFQRGSVTEWIRVYEQLATDTTGLILAPGLAAMHAREGNLDEARRLLDRLSADGFDIPLDFLWLSCIVACAAAAMELGDQPSAMILYGELAPFADMLPCNGAASAGPVSFHLGGLAMVLRDFDDSERFFEQAAQFSERSGTKYFAAETRYWKAKMLVARNGPKDVDLARELLEHARSAAITFGYRDIERRAEDALQALG